MIFARRMMKKARADITIPEDLYAKVGSQCNDSTITKIMFCDHSKIMRHPVAMNEVDLKECYDKMAYPQLAWRYKVGVFPKTCAALF